MAIIVITDLLRKQILRKFKEESKTIFKLFLSLHKNPKKGKYVGKVKNIAVKELKYKSFRFYFILDNYKIKFLDILDLEDLIIQFIRMSDKNKQKQTIEEIKNILKKLGVEGF